MKTQVFEDPRSMQTWCRQLQAEGKSIGFVPTMGALHPGHIRLVEASLSENDITVVSIFVNPTQFNDSKDFEHYPRPMEKDVRLLKDAGVHALFLPSAPSMYPTGQDMAVKEEELSQILCGAHRPGHFSGMMTIVLKLLNLVAPTRAYFGDKDFQQVLLVEKMVETFFMPVEIVRVPTVRDESGVALSSRNERLTDSQKAHLAKFPHILRSASTDDEASKHLQSEGFNVDYVTTYKNYRHGAVHLGGVRFIDHVEL